MSARKRRRFPKCLKCNCPLTNLIVDGKKERRRTCARCLEGLMSAPSKYGTRPLEVRLAKREAKRLWAERKRSLLTQRRKERIASDPEKYREAQRLYKLRHKQRVQEGRPLIREQSATLPP